MNKVIIHFPPIIIAMAILTSSGVLTNFQSYISLFSVIIFTLGLSGILYISYTSEELFHLTFSKLTIASIGYSSAFLGMMFFWYSFVLEKWLLCLIASSICALMFLLSLKLLKNLGKIDA